MSLVPGKDQYFTFNLSQLSGGSVLSEVKLQMGSDELDASVIGSNWKAYLQGQAEATLNISGVWDSASTATSISGLMANNVNNGGTKLWEYMPGGSASGGIVHKGNGFVTSYEVGGAVGDKVPFAASIRVSGSVTTTTAS